MWFWRKPRLDTWRAGYAVRCDYPGFGTHEYVGFRIYERAAVRFAKADADYFRRGPVRVVHSVVVISLRDFELHARRRDCRAPDCPITTQPLTRVRATDRGER